MKVDEYWHGTIKNYRYDGDVSTATVHKDSGEMVSVNYWVEHQGSQSSMPDTGRMIPAIKSDRQDDKG